jgi:hypothetical protein
MKTRFPEITSGGECLPECLLSVRFQFAARPTRRAKNLCLYRSLCGCFQPYGGNWVRLTLAKRNTDPITSFGFYLC